MSGDRRRSAGRDLPIDLSLNLSPVAYDAAAFEPSAVMGSAAEELMVRRLSAGGRRIRTCMGLFLSSCIFGLLPVLCSERESRSSFRRLRSGSRSGRKGQGTETVAMLGGLPPSELVFRSALTSEHAER